MKTPLKILIVEDSQDDADMILQELHRAGLDPKWKRVQTEPDFLEELNTLPDIILSDLAMPQFSGLRAAELLHSSGLDIPFVIISGTIGEEAAVEAMKRGAADYLLKDRIKRLGQVVSQALEKKRLRDERHLVEESLNLFRSLVDQSTDGIEVIDPGTGRFLDVNETACQRLGYQRAEMLAMDVFDIDEGGMDLSAWREYVEKVRQSSLRVYESRQKRKDGSTFPVEVSIRFVKLDRYYLIASVRDISKRKQAEQSLSETSALLETLLQNATDHIYFKDLQSRFVRFSSAMLQYFDLANPDELTGRTDFDLFTEESARSKFEAEQEIIRSGQPVLNLEEMITRVDGRVGWVMSSKMPWRDPAGQIVGIIGISREITERKQAQNALEDLSRKTKQRERILTATLSALKDFAYIFDRECRFLFVNEALLGLWGITLEAAVGKTFFDLKYPDELAGKLQRQVKEVFDSKQSLTDETYYTRPTGLAGFYEYIFSPAFAVDGTVEFVAGSTRDITRRKRLEESLLDAERFLRSSLDALSAHIAILDEQGKIIEVNAAWKRFAGDGNSVGRNYLKACDIASGNYSEEAPVVADGIRAVIAGQREEFQLEYPCHSSTQEEWFVVRVTRFDHRGLVRVVVAHENITRRKLAEEARQKQQEFLEVLIENISEGILACDANGTPTLSNRKLREFHGMSTDLIPPERWGEYFDLHLSDGKTPMKHEQTPLYRALHEGKVTNVELVITPKNRPVRLVLVSGQSFCDKMGVRAGAVVVVHDITERKKLEFKLLESQKLETVGKLAGGIAHEFNSILTAIIGQSEMMLNDLPAAGPLAQKATEISRAAQRAASLTRQLLAYGRRQLLQPVDIDLNRLIAGMESVIRHLLGLNVNLQIVPAIDLYAVKADAGQIEQVITNLVINARDAMPHGGKLTIETANVSFEAQSVGRYPELKPGDYVMLAITDNGSGMAPDVKARLFEPFFSTKGVGGGTGLGLSSSYGIIKQSGGHISVYSEPDRGTTFKIYLLRSELPPKLPIPRPDPPDLLRGSETILLVEDDPALRDMAATLLRRMGYTVLATTDGIEALRVQNDFGTGQIDLLFTDVVMPHISGKDLADRIRGFYPRMKTLFTSAFTANAITHQGVLNEGEVLLQKPYTPSALSLKVRQVLDKQDTPKLHDALETRVSNTLG